MRTGNPRLAPAQQVLFLTVGLIGPWFTTFSTLMPRAERVADLVRRVLRRRLRPADHEVEHRVPLRDHAGGQTILSLVPPWSPVRMPIRLVAGTATWREALTALGILAASAVATIRVAEHRYRRSLLQPGGVPQGWRRALIERQEARLERTGGIKAAMTAAATVVSLIGVPTDVGAGARGASMGPEAMRVAGLAAALARRGVTVEDRGNLAGPPNPWQPPVDGYRHLEEVLAWNSTLHQAMYQALADGTVPIMLGGDHSLSVGSVSAAARHCRGTGKQLRVIWLDAHADFNTADVTPSGNIHGMPVSTLCGIGHPRLAAIGGHTPAIQPSWVRQIGIRSVDDAEKHLVHDQALPVYDMRSIDENGMRATMEAALDGVDEHTHLHVSFDVDFLDPEIAPGVGTTVRGGPTYREAQLCMEMIADTGRLGSVDVTELNPSLDHRNTTAEVAVELVESLFGKSTLVRRVNGNSPHLL